MKWILVLGCVCVVSCAGGGAPEAPTSVGDPALERCLARDPVVGRVPVAVDRVVRCPSGEVCPVALTPVDEDTSARRAQPPVSVRELETRFGDVSQLEVARVDPADGRRRFSGLAGDLTREASEALWLRHRQPLCRGVPAGEVRVADGTAPAVVRVRGGLSFEGSAMEVARFERTQWSIALVPTGLKPGRPTTRDGRRQASEMPVAAVTFGGAFELTAFAGTYDVYVAMRGPVDRPVDDCTRADIVSDMGFSQVASAVTLTDGQHLELEVAPILVSGRVLPGDTALTRSGPLRVTFQGAGHMRELDVLPGQTYAAMLWPGTYEVCVGPKPAPRGHDHCRRREASWARVERHELVASTEALDVSLETVDVALALALPRSWSAMVYGAELEVAQTDLEVERASSRPTWTRRYQPGHLAGDVLRLEQAVPRGIDVDLTLELRSGRGAHLLADGTWRLASLSDLEADVDLGTRRLDPVPLSVRTNRPLHGSAHELAAVLRSPDGDLEWRPRRLESETAAAPGVVHHASQVTAGVYDVWVSGWLARRCVEVSATHGAVELELDWRTVRFELPGRPSRAVRYRLLRSADGLTPAWDRPATVSSLDASVEVALLPGVYEVVVDGAAPLVFELK